MALPYRWRWHIERWKSALRGLLGGRQEEPRPKVCPACGALVGIAASRCHECGSRINFSLAAASRKLSDIFGGHAPVTSVLLIVNVLLYGISLAMTAQAGGGFNLFGGISGQALNTLGASRIDLILQGEWYRLVTAMFLHGSLIHIGCNMMVLLDVGPLLEELYGAPRYLFLYVLTGMLSFVVSALFGHLAVGASGALMGLIGLMLAITTKRGGAHMKALRSRLLTWVVITFLIGFTLPGVDNAAHSGGLAAGFVLGKVFADREPFSGAERKRAQALGWLAGLVVLASFVMMLKQFMKV